MTFKRFQSELHVILAVIELYLSHYRMLIDIHVIEIKYLKKSVTILGYNLLILYLGSSYIDARCV